MPRRMLITAGPTHEPIDQVRYIANQSSGKMGIAIAEAARDAGWDVTLLLGLNSVPPPLLRGDTAGSAPPIETRTPPTGAITNIRFTTTEDLRTLLAEHFPKCDVLVMAAAVADYRPVKGAAGKIERGAKRLMLELEPTPDLVAECAKRKRPDQFIVGFALEEQGKLRDRALDKLKRKGLDAIVANPLETMGSEAIDATMYQRDESGEMRETRLSVPTLKSEFAEWLMRWLEQLRTA